LNPSSLSSARQVRSRSTSNLGTIMTKRPSTSRSARPKSAKVKPPISITTTTSESYQTLTTPNWGFESILLSCSQSNPVQTSKFLAFLYPSLNDINQGESVILI
jgi:hypothetical protein